MRFVLNLGRIFVNIKESLWLFWQEREGTVLLPPKNDSLANTPVFPYHFRCQILSLYSRMVRSEEKMPEQAVLVMAMRSHFS